MADTYDLPVFQDQRVKYVLTGMDRRFERRRIDTHSFRIMAWEKHTVMEVHDYSIVT